MIDNEQFRRGSRTDKEKERQMFPAQQEELEIMCLFSDLINDSDSKFQITSFEDLDPDRGKTVRGNYRDKGDFKIHWLYRDDFFGDRTFTQITDIKKLSHPYKKWIFKEHEIQSCFRKGWPVLYVHNYTFPNAKFRWFSLDDLENQLKIPPYPLAEIKFDHDGWRLFENEFDDWMSFNTLPIREFNDRTLEVLSAAEKVQKSVH